MTRADVRKALTRGAAAVVLAGLGGGLAAACRDAGQERPASAAAPAGAAPAQVPEMKPDAAALNAVQREMRLLLEALQGTVAAIADNDLARVPELVHGVHDARAATDAALEDGSYRPPKNPDNLAAFKAMDEAFHQELVALVNAARADDLAATTTSLSAVLRQCQGCHAMFREMPADTATPVSDVH